MGWCSGMRTPFRGRSGHWPEGLLLERRSRSGSRPGLSQSETGPDAARTMTTSCRDHYHGVMSLGSQCSPPRGPAFCEASPSMGPSDRDHPIPAKGQDGRAKRMRHLCIFVDVDQLLPVTMGRSHMSTTIEWKCTVKNLWKALNERSLGQSVSSVCQACSSSSKIAR